MKLDEEVEVSSLTAKIVLVDDGSTIAAPEGLVQRTYRSIIGIDGVSLRRTSVTNVRSRSAFIRRSESPS